MFSAYIITVLIISLITFMLYAIDKSKSSNNANNRIPEVVLISLPLLGSNQIASER